MRYAVYISRLTESDDSLSSKITLDEWSGYVAGDQEMRMDNFEEIHDPKTGEVARFESEGIAVWTAYSQDQERGPHAWFVWDDDGKIHVNSPDDEILGKMIQIADRLNAKVRGEEAEIYDKAYLANRAKERDRRVDDTEHGSTPTHSQLNQAVWFFWWVGTALIVLSWIDVVSPITGWVGFGIAFAATVASVIAGKYWRMPPTDETSKED